MLVLIDTVKGWLNNLSLGFLFRSKSRQRRAKIVYYFDIFTLLGDRSFIIFYFPRRWISLEGQWFVLRPKRKNLGTGNFHFVVASPGRRPYEKFGSDSRDTNSRRILRHWLEFGPRRPPVVWSLMSLQYEMSLRESLSYLLPPLTNGSFGRSGPLIMTLTDVWGGYCLYLLLNISDWPSKDRHGDEWWRWMTVRFNQCSFVAPYVSFFGGRFSCKVL